MSITREQLKNIVKETLKEESEYQVFFRKALEKAGKSIPSMSDEEKKEFFNKIDKAWNGKGEKNEGNAFGAAVVAAKEKGEDEFELDGKTYKVEESHDCGCGCGGLTEGGCQTNLNEAKKVNPASKKFLKGMKKIKVKGLGGYMPGVDYVYVDGDKYYFVDFEGDHMELKNISTIKQLHKLHGKSLGESVNENAYKNWLKRNDMKDNRDNQSLYHYLLKKHKSVSNFPKHYESVNEGVKIKVPGNIIKKVKKNPNDVYQSSEYAADGSRISYFSDKINNKYYVVYHGKNYEVAKYIDIKGNPNKFDGEGYFQDFVKKYDRTKKLESVNESHDCGCGCGGVTEGGCQTNVNEAASDRDFEKVFDIFDKKDYFHLKGSIKTMLGNWQRALDRGDKGAQQYSKEDVIDSVTAQTKARAKHTYDELVKAIKNKDIKALKSKLRHNQPFSIAIFTQVTGKKLPKSTRDIHSFLDNEFTNESVNEGRLGKVSLLKSVEKGETSRVEGVKISPDLAFELRMFLERPLMARSRTGIQIDNAQMKDAIPMLAKVGVHKRLSSGVKKEFTDLLKKYK